MTEKQKKAKNWCLNSKGKISKYQDFFEQGSLEWQVFQQLFLINKCLSKFDSHNAEELCKPILEELTELFEVVEFHNKEIRVFLLCYFLQLKKYFK